MGPSPTRKIQVEESNIPTARPLDAALRQPANDNFSAINNPRPRDTAIRQRSRQAPRVTYKNNTLSQNPSYTSTDQQFNDSYARQGLQPSVGSVSQYRKVQTEQGDNTPNQMPPAQLQGTPVTGRPPRTKNSNPDRARSIERSLRKPKPAGGVLKKITNPKKAALSKLPGGAAEIANRVIATEVTVGIFSWSIWVWIALQLPLAIMALVFFGLAVGWESAIKSLGFVGTALSYVAGLATSAIKTLSGLDLSQFNPQNFFMIANTATMFTGYCILLAIGLIYTIAGIPCLSGKGASFKQIALIVACFGYFIPLLNMLPWAFVWVLAVWIYPTGDED